MVKYLDSICEDCYLLYRDPDVYNMCKYVRKKGKIKRAKGKKRQVEM
jgi:hypothetical protein